MAMSEHVDLHFSVVIFLFIACSATHFSNDLGFFVILDVVQTKGSVEFNTGLYKLEFNTLNIYCAQDP